MKRRELFFVLGAFGAITFSSVHLVDASVSVLTPIELPASFQYPNGITHASDATLYIGSITSGQILRIDPTGKVETLFTGNADVFAATSLRLDEPRGVLWGSSPDFLGTPSPSGELVRRPPRVFAIDTRSGAVLRVIPMPEGGFSNDLALDSAGSVYITDKWLIKINYTKWEKQLY
jgi:sugar lactone lactonase YvrE